MKSNVVRLQTEAKIAAALSGTFREMWRAVYHHLHILRKQGEDDDDHAAGRDPDWDQWKRGLLLLLMALLMDAAQTLGEAEAEDWRAQGRTVEVDREAIYALYLLQAEGRLTRMADAARKAVELEVARWQASDMTLDDLVRRLEPWFGEARAVRIASTETGFLQSATAKWTMTRLDLHRWRWKHWGGDIPCGRCLPRVGRIYTVNDPMPPIHPHDHCTPEPLD